MGSPIALLNSPGAHFVIGSGLEYGVGYAVGQAYHRHGDKWIGRNAPRLAAGAGKGGALLALLLTKGKGHFLGSIANGVGSAGLVAMGLDKGLRDARKATGKRAVLIPSNAALPAGGREVTNIGALPARGRGLTDAQIEELATVVH